MHCRALVFLHAATVRMILLLHPTCSEVFASFCGIFLRRWISYSTARIMTTRCRHERNVCHRTNALWHFYLHFAKLMPWFEISNLLLDHRNDFFPLCFLRDPSMFIKWVCFHDIAHETSLRFARTRTCAPKCFRNKWDAKSEGYFQTLFQVVVVLLQLE